MRNRRRTKVGEGGAFYCLWDFEPLMKCFWAVKGAFHPFYSHLTGRLTINNLKIRLWLNWRWSQWSAETLSVDSSTEPAVNLSELSSSPAGSTDPLSRLIIANKTQKKETQWASSGLGKDTGQKRGREWVKRAMVGTESVRPEDARHHQLRKKEFGMLVESQTNKREILGVI